MTRFHNGEGIPATNIQTAAASASRMLVTIFRNHRESGKHSWVTEQQTGHRVCSWCNACEDPRCSNEEG